MKAGPGTIHLALLLAIGASLARGAAGGIVALRDSVEVNRETVLLSDLLPAQAESEIRTKCEAIPLGRTPLPGSVRVFDAAQIAAHIANEPDLLARLSIPARIVVRSSGWPLTSANIRDLIAAFLQRRRADFGDLPGSATLSFAVMGTREPAPSLEVTSAAWDRRHAVLDIRLRCLESAVCGSFLVQVDESASPDAGLRKTNQARPGGQTPDAPPAGATTLAERGKPATLVLDGENLRISMQVVCLERGTLKQRIRVIDANSRRVYRAEVVGAHLLHANF